MDPSGMKKLPTVAEVARDRGMKVGVVTSVFLNDATPAAFYAARPSRTDFYEIGVQMEKLEQEVLNDAEREDLHTILDMRRKLGVLRRTMLPHRAVFSHLANSRDPLFDATASLNFRDTLENVLRLTDAVDQQRDQLSNVKDTYLSVISQRTHEIMTVLTLSLIPISEPTRPY